LTNVEGRLIKVELETRALREENRALRVRAETLEQQGRQPMAMMWQGGGGGGEAIPLWAMTPGPVAAATGVWPTLTPSTFTSDVVKDVGGTMTPVATGATIRWFYKDTATIGKLVPVMDNGDGTYDARATSCTRVDV